MTIATYILAILIDCDNGNSKCILYNNLAKENANEDSSRIDELS